jgi:hypothetical protein
MRIITLLTIGTLLCLAAPAQELDGRKIHAQAGDYMSVYVPLSLPCDTADPGGVISVHQLKTGKEFPATLRDGELVFIPEGMMPGTEHEYTVKVATPPGGYTPKVVITKRENEQVLDVVIEDLPFTSYHYSNDNKKPFLWPVLSEGGVGVTRDFPMKTEDTPRFAQDHPHHKSLYAAYGEVNGVDCWAEGGNSGAQRSGEVTWGSGDAYGWIKAKNSWVDKDDKHILTEEREYRFYATPEKGRLIDAYITFTADAGDVLFSDTKEGGIVAVRMRPELSYAKGIITNAHGDQGEENLWGKPSPWCDYSGEMPDIGWRGLAVLDHPSNLRYPTSWHVRKYGLMGANCFGYSYFIEKDFNKGLMPDNGDYTIKNGEQLAFRHRIYVHSGNVEQAAVADRHADFATPPAVRWAD